jgi:hypothetical protein
LFFFVAFHYVFRELIAFAIHLAGVQWLNAGGRDVYAVVGVFIGGLVHSVHESGSGETL